MQHNIGLLLGSDDLVAEFVAKGIWGEDTQKRIDAPYTAIGIMQNKELIGGVVFHSYDADSGVIEASAFATTPRWYTRQVRDYLLNYAFNTNGCRILCARTDENNHKVRNLWKKLGATETILPQFIADDTDQILIILHREKA